MADCRWLFIGSAAVLAACSQGADTPEPPAGSESLISCAIAPAAQFSRVCSVDRVLQDGALYLLINHPGGGFRRLLVKDDGTGVMAADGADEARITVLNGEIEVSLDGDRYLLPATIADDGAQ